MIAGPGARIGPYDVIALLGQGGMGDVWRARHTSLKRDDALTVLPAALAADPERLARFSREAQVLASLGHPHIAQIYGLENVDGMKRSSWSSWRARLWPTAWTSGPSH